MTRLATRLAAFVLACAVAQVTVAHDAGTGSGVPRAAFRFEALIARHRLAAIDGGGPQFEFVLRGKDGQERRCAEAAAREYPLLASGSEAYWICKCCSRFGSMRWSAFQWARARRSFLLR